MAFTVTANGSSGFDITLGGGTTGQIKVWTGASNEAKPVKVWNGFALATKPLKVWNGSAWVTTNY